MERMIRNLSVLLMVQVALGAAVLLLRPGLSGAAPASPLIALAPAAIDQVTIDGDGKTTTLQLKDKRWTVQQLDGFPADQAEVAAFIDRVAAVKRGLPLATSTGALKRFKVADDGYDRKIVLAGAGKTLGTIYVGSAIDARHANGRAAGDPAVYSIGLPTFEVPAAPGDWSDKSVLQTPKDDVASITIGPLTLVREAPASPAPADAGANATPGASVAGTATAAATAAAPAGAAGPAATPPATTPAAAPLWRASAGASGSEQVDPAAVDRLGDALARLQVGAPLGTAPKPDFSMDTPALELTLKKKDGTAIVYQVGKKRAGGDYVVKSSLRPEFFVLPGYAGEQLINDAKREALVKNDAATRPAAATPPPPAKSS
jgi:uncharacterized protein DUF4340